ncbi:hypothetical protein [Raineyella sp. LH-20]|uniref:hypothetical protein n=1 Tax=Raineyella sp. LH-20 TaxID=3081204 RepID=UPI002952EFFC|nr:hypothetical protein [Raineyella sp. LH-20]WOP18657.1 hypothetical protein R0146_15890 [Raineyella sp. LH-20]
MRSRGVRRSLAAVMVVLALGGQAMIGTSAAAAPKDGMPATAKNNAAVNNGKNNHGNNDNGGNNGPTVPLGTVTPPRTTLTAAQGRTGPSVALDTMAVDGAGRPGVRVGTAFHPAPFLSGTSYTDGHGAKAEWQLLVLNTQDLTVKLSRTYSTATAADLPKDFQVLVDGSADLNYRVIVTNHPAAGWVAGEGLQGTLGPLGYTYPDAARFPTGSLAQGDFSMIVSVTGSGDQPVQKNVQSKWSDTYEGGRIQAPMVLNRWGNYTYLSNQFVTIDTRSSFGCDQPATNCALRIRVGDPANDVVRSLNGGAGYLVAVYDKLTLSKKNDTVFATNGPDAAANVVSMTTYLAGLSTTDPGDVVVVSSIRNPGDSAHNITVAPAVHYDTMSALAQQIAAIGGTRDQFNRAAATPSADYNLVGWVGPGTSTAPREGTGAENIGTDSRLSTEMSLDTESLFRPSVSSPIPLPVDGLRDVAYGPQSSQPWPQVNTVAMTDIARRLQLSDPDIRQAYWRSVDENWTSDANTLARFDYQPTSAYTKDDFDRTKTELIDEFSKVALIRARAAALGKPYARAAAEAQTTANRVAGQIAVDKNSNVQWSWMKFGDQFVGVLGSLMGFGNATKLADSSTKMVAATVAGASRAISAASAMGQYGKDTNVPTYEQISIKANQLGEQIQAAMDETRAGYSREADMILADYAKFQAVTSWNCTTADDPAAPQGTWAWCHATDDPSYGTPTYSAALRSAERVSWTGLAPLEFGVYQLDISTITDLTYYGYSGGGDINCGPNFTNAGIFTVNGGPWPEETVARLQQNDGGLAPEYNPWMARPEYQIYVMGKIKYSSPWGKTNYPQPVPASIYHRMFDPVSTSDLTPSAGGLGIRADKYLPTLPHNPLHGCHWYTGYYHN